jgi:hypothetical protein
MNYKRAAGIALAAYVASFAIGLSMQMLARYEMLPAGVFQPNALLAIQLITTIAVGIGFTWWYFISPSASASWNHGLYFGLVMVGVGFLADTIFMAVLFAAGIPLALILGIYADLVFWISVAALIASAIGTAEFMSWRARMVSNVD